MRFPLAPDYDELMDVEGPAVQRAAGAGGDRVSLERAAGKARLRLRGGGGVAELYQEGALRLRLPHPADRSTVEVVAINNAGGLTGGDQLDLEARLDAGAQGMITTPACEKIYRSIGGVAHVATRLHLASASTLDWLPQPMLLFDGACVRRQLIVDIAADASLLAVEGVILGRTAMNEEMRSGDIRDSWRVRRAGALVYADTFRALGPVSDALGSHTTLGGARAFATVLAVAPGIESRLEAARAALSACTSETGASAWNGILVVRFVAGDGGTLIADLSGFLGSFRAAALPRSWLC
jgi:urease accessory protein